MSNNLDHIDERIRVEKSKLKEASENADMKTFNAAETELQALNEMRKFYERVEGCIYE